MGWASYYLGLASVDDGKLDLAVAYYDQAIQAIESTPESGRGQNQEILRAARQSRIEALQNRGKIRH